MAVTAIIMSLAGTLGAILRYGVTKGGNALFNDTQLPVATLIINLIGAFCLGLAMHHFASGTLAWQLSSGLLAGFTTYSTFINEVVSLKSRRPKLAGGYFLLSAVLGVIVAAAGLML